MWATKSTEAGRREIAIELGEGAERAAADPHAWERPARGGVKAGEQRRGRHRRPGIGADAVLRRHDEDGLKQGRERRDTGRESREFRFDIVAGQDRLERKAGADRFGEARRSPTPEAECRRTWRSTVPLSNCTPVRADRIDAGKASSSLPAGTRRPIIGIVPAVGPPRTISVSVGFVTIVTGVSPVKETVTAWRTVSPAARV